MTPRVALVADGLAILFFNYWIDFSCVVVLVGDEEVQELQGFEQLLQTQTEKDEKAIQLT